MVIVGALADDNRRCERMYLGGADLYLGGAESFDTITSVVLDGERRRCGRTGLDFSMGGAESFDLTTTIMCL